jgi:hypothetical protein
MKGKLIWSIFWASVVVFVIAIAAILISDILRFVGMPSWVAMALLGITLIVLTIKQKVAGSSKVYLLLTGSSLAAMPLFIVLHNLVYALFITWFGTDFWGSNGAGDEPVFFILAIIICPLGFLVGAAGTVITALKNRSSEGY